MPKIERLDPALDRLIAPDAKIEILAQGYDWLEGPVWTRSGLPDGLKVDTEGNLFATGPGGILILTPQGKHLGTILTGQATGNCAFGDDGRTLYITADMYVMRIRLKARGLDF